MAHEGGGASSPGGGGGVPPGGWSRRRHLQRVVDFRALMELLPLPRGREKYLNTLLQVEVMLKLWFPHIPTKPGSASPGAAAFAARSLQDTSGSIPPHKHRDQLHIPVKVSFHLRVVPHSPHSQTNHVSLSQKRRLSWTGTDSPTPSPVLHKCPRLGSEERRGRGDLPETEGRAPPPLDSSAGRAPADVAGNSQLNQDSNGRDNGAEDLGALSKYKAGHSSEPNLTWVHIAPILSPRKACPSHEGAGAGGGERQAAAAGHPLSRRGSPATQDSAVSSTTPSRHPKAPKKPPRCQSQPAAGHQSGNNEPCQGQNQSHVTVKPLPRACPSSLET